MVDIKKQQISNLLSEIKNIEGVQGYFVVSTEGKLIASNWHLDFDTDTIATMIAAMQSSIETEIDELDQGKLIEITINTSKGKIFSTCFDKTSIQVIFSEPSNALENIKNRVSEICKTIARLNEPLDNDSPKAG